MRARQPIDPDHQSTRGALRIIGPLVLVIGLLFMIVGIADFFASFSSFGPPTKFWCCFVGMPLLAIGAAICKYAFLGKVARYVSQEITPVATDTFNYAAKETRDGVREIAGAIADGVRHAGPAPEAQFRCHKCNHANDSDAKFCSECGAPLQKNVLCPTCSELNDPDARFCDNCGRRIAQEP